jgi:hypothetical protein
MFIADRCITIYLSDNKWQYKMGLTSDDKHYNDLPQGSPSILVLYSFDDIYYLNLFEIVDCVL